MRFECTFCQAPMSAQESEIGKFMSCPSCGRTVIVPTTSQLPEQPQAQGPPNAPPRRPARRSGKPPVQSQAIPPVKNQPIRLGQLSRNVSAVLKKVLIVLAIAVAGLVIYRVARPGWGPGISFNSQTAEFPSSIDMMKTLHGFDYMSLNADGSIETLDGRRLQRFSYATSGPTDRRGLRQIDLWCPVGDSARVVALSSVISSPTRARKSSRRDDLLEDLNPNKPLSLDATHAMSVWIIVSEISGITESDRSHPFSRKGSRGRKYRKNRFRLELHDKALEKKTDGTGLQEKWLVLKDGSW